MAVDKLVDSTQLDSGLAAIADAIRAKGGTSASLAFPTGMTDAIAAIPSGGALPLPPGISKQDSGSFTVAETTKTDLYAISHNLGEAPKGFYLWTDDETSASATDIYALINSAFLQLTHDSQSGTSVVGNEMVYYRVTTGKTASTSKTITSAQLSGYVTDSQLKVNNPSINFRAGNTYKWVAWA